MVMAVPEDVRNSIIAGIPVGRLGKPEEIAALVTFIASESTVIDIDSGLVYRGYCYHIILSSNVVKQAVIETEGVALLWKLNSSYNDC